MQEELQLSIAGHLEPSGALALTIVNRKIYITLRTKILTQSELIINLSNREIPEFGPRWIWAYKVAGWSNWTEFFPEEGTGLNGAYGFIFNPSQITSGIVNYLPKTVRYVKIKSAFKSESLFYGDEYDLKEIKKQLRLLNGHFSELEELDWDGTFKPLVSAVECGDYLDLRQLSNFRTLKKLSLKENKISSFSSLAQLEQLEELSLEQTEVRREERVEKNNRNSASKNLLDLSSLKSLKKLNLRSVILTEEQLATLKELLPECEIDR